MAYCESAGAPAAAHTGINSSLKWMSIKKADTELLKWATAKVPKLEWWKINAAIPLKNKWITGAVLVS